MSNVNEEIKASYENFKNEYAKDATAVNRKIADVLQVSVRKVSAILAHHSGKVKASKAKVKSVESNSFTHEGGVNKDKCRNKFADGVIASGETGLIATLPHIHCVTEKLILASGLSNTFVARETDRATYKQCKKVVRAEKLPIVTKVGQFNDLIYNTDADTYAHMFADYCGGLMTLKHEIMAIFQKDIVRVGGTIGITLSLRGSVRDGDTVDQMGNKDDQDARPKSIKGIEGFFNKAIGFKYNITELFRYSDSVDGKKGQAMVLVMIKRLR